MTNVPWALLEREYSSMGVDAGSLPPRDQRAVGMVFMPQGEDDAAVCRSVVEKMMAGAGLAFHGWRTVPVDASSLGPQSRENQPTIEQVRVWLGGGGGLPLDACVFLPPARRWLAYFE